MTRSLALFALLVACLLKSSVARADALPDGLRDPALRLRVESVADHPDHVFFVYPTKNTGYAYRFDGTTPIASLLATERQGHSRLCAMKRSGFDALDPKPLVAPHADDGSNVEVFRPPSTAPCAPLPIPLPKRVPSRSGVVAVERVYRIARLDDDAFEIVLASERIETASEPSPGRFGSPHDRTGCGACTAAHEGGASRAVSALVAAGGVLLVLGRRRGSARVLRSRTHPHADE